MKTKYLLCIVSYNGILNGYIYTNTKCSMNAKCSINDIVDLADITFDPLTILGDIKYIAKEIPLTSKMPDFHIPSSTQFKEPYSIENCLNLKIEHNVEYFTLLRILKDIITNDNKMSFEDLKKMDSFLNIHIPYTFSSKNDYKDGIFATFTPRVYGLCDEDIINKPLSSSHIYTCPCKSISELVYAIFTYLILHNYHFYRCEHCHRYSAIKKKQGVQKYCFRNNILNIPKYEGDSCADAVDKFLDKIRARKKKIYNYFDKHGEEIESSDPKLNDERKLFQEQYDNYIKNIKEHGATPENLMSLSDFIDTYAKEVNRRKKERG